MASIYAEISEALGRDESAPLTGNEAVVIKPLYTDYDSSGYVGCEVTLRLQQGDVDLSVVQMLEERVMTWSFPDGYLIVSDEVFSSMASEIAPLNFKAYSVEDQKSTKATSMLLEQLELGNEQLGAENRQLKLEGLEHAPMSTYYADYREGLESAGLNIFLLRFLGLVFLAATGSMVYFKRLTDAHADKARYEILRRIGVSRREIYKSIAKQTLFVFALPQTVGLVHSSMMLKAMSSTDRRPVDRTHSKCNGWICDYLPSVLCIVREFI